MEATDTNPFFGVNVPPWVVGLVRGLIGAVGVAIVGAVITFAEGDELAAALTDLPPVVQVGIAALLPYLVVQLYGLMDQIRKRFQNDAITTGPGLTEEGPAGAAPPLPPGISTGSSGATTTYTTGGKA